MSSQNGQPGPVQMQVPVIELGGVTLSVQPAPLDPTKRAIMVGPVFLQLSLDDDARKVLVKALTGIEIARPGDVI